MKKNKLFLLAILLLILFLLITYLGMIFFKKKDTSTVQGKNDKQQTITTSNGDEAFQQSTSLETIASDVDSETKNAKEDNVETGNTDDATTGNQNTDNTYTGNQNTDDATTGIQNSNNMYTGNQNTDNTYTGNQNSNNMYTGNQNIEEQFFITPITDKIKKRITGISFPDTTETLEITFEDLSYIHILYVDFEGNTKEGEIICNQIISEDLLEIFRELYNASYPLESVQLVDEFGGDDEISMEANNTSCFNYRVVPGTSKLSNHSYGLAIDINPFYNPYVTKRNGSIMIQPAQSEAYIDREQDFPHKIDHEDLCYKLFLEHGFSWGGDWKNSKDYQHFEYKKD